MSHATHVPLTVGDGDDHDHAHHPHHHHHQAPAHVVHHVHDTPCCGPLITGILWGVVALISLLLVSGGLSGLYSVPETISIFIDFALVVALCVCGILAHLHPTVKAAKRYRLVIMIYAGKCVLNVLLQIVLIATHDTPDVTLPPGWEAGVTTISYGSVIFGACISAIIVFSCYSCATTHLRLVSNFDVEMGDLAQQTGPQVMQVAPMQVPMTMVPMPVNPAVPPPMPFLAPGPPMPYSVPAELTAVPPPTATPTPIPTTTTTATTTATQVTPAPDASLMPLLAPQEFVDPPPMRAIKAPSSAVDDSFDPRG